MAINLLVGDVFLTAKSFGGEVFLGTNPSAACGLGKINYRSKRQGLSTRPLALLEHDVPWSAAGDISTCDGSMNTRYDPLSKGFCGLPP